MKVLKVFSGNSGVVSPFIKDQIDCLELLGVKIKTFMIKGRGMSGYLYNLRPLKEKIKDIKPDIIHAHYGFSGLLASLQRKIPTITTFHGSDINIKTNSYFSFLASRLSTENIFTHESLPKKIGYNKQAKIISCGVNMNNFYPVSQSECRKKLGLNDNKIYALFSSSFENKNKNYPLALKSVKMCSSKIEIIELKGFSREKVNLLINAVDFVIITSFSETGPLIAKEAMACNVPVVSVDVGQIKDIFGDEKGYFVCSYEPEDIKDKINYLLNTSQKLNGRKRINDFRRG